MGNYILTTLPFGAVNRPYVFLVISEIFPIFIYMDDILIATANVDNEVALIKTFIKNIVELLAWEGGCGAGGMGILRVRVQFFFFYFLTIVTLLF